MFNLKRTIAASLAAGVLVVAAGAAHAVSSVSIVWRTFGGATIGTPSVSASTTVLADIVLTADAAGIGAIVMSFTFDDSELTFLGGNELTSVNLPSMGNVFNPLAQGGIALTGPGALTGFDQATLQTGLISATRTLGSLKFHVAATVGDPSDIDLIAGFFEGPDGAIDIGNGPVPTTFTGAAVTPEPTTALLVLVGIGGLAYAGRRSIR